MPNWCEGKMKIRGKFSDVVDCIKGSFEGRKWNSEKQKSEPTNENIKVEEFYTGEVEFHFNDVVYIKDTRRAFVDGECLVWTPDGDKNSETVAVVSIRQAWAIVPDNYTEMSKRYNVDIRIQAFERGMQFEQDVIIEKGEIKKDEVKEYKGWDWEWSCPCPDLGG